MLEGTSNYGEFMCVCLCMHAAFVCACMFLCTNALKTERKVPKAYTSLNVIKMSRWKLDIYTHSKITLLLNIKSIIMLLPCIYHSHFKRYTSRASAN